MALSSGHSEALCSSQTPCSGRTLYAPELAMWNFEAAHQHCKYVVLMCERYSFRIFPEYVKDDAQLNKLKIKHALADEDSRQFLSVIGILNVSFEEPVQCESKKRKRSDEK